jgi:hypothetical protein
MGREGAERRDAPGLGAAPRQLAMPRHAVSPRHVSPGSSCRARLSPSNPRPRPCAGRRTRRRTSAIPVWQRGVEERAVRSLTLPTLCRQQANCGSRGRRFAAYGAASRDTAHGQRPTAGWFSEGCFT